LWSETLAEEPASPRGKHAGARVSGNQADTARDALRSRASRSATPSGAPRSDYGLAALHDESGREFLPRRYSRRWRCTTTSYARTGRPPGSTSWNAPLPPPPPAHDQVPASMPSMMTLGSTSYVYWGDRARAAEHRGSSALDLGDPGQAPRLLPAGPGHQRIGQRRLPAGGLRLLRPRRWGPPGPRPDRGRLAPQLTLRCAAWAEWNPPGAPARSATAGPNGRHTACPCHQRLPRHSRVRPPGIPARWGRPVRPWPRRQWARASRAVLFLGLCGERGLYLRAVAGPLSWIRPSRAPRFLACPSTSSVPCRWQPSIQGNKQ
jgi:hypothetical protein